MAPDSARASETPDGHATFEGTSSKKRKVRDGREKERAREKEKLRKVERCDTRKRQVEIG